MTWPLLLTITRNITVDVNRVCTHVKDHQSLLPVHLATLKIVFSESLQLAVSCTSMVDVFILFYY